MAPPFSAATFTWPFRLAVSAPLIPLAVGLLFGVGEMLWGKAPVYSIIDVLLSAFWIACVVTGIAEVVALPTAVVTLFRHPAKRTPLNFFSTAAGILALIFVAVMGAFWSASRPAI
jgi:hypothetical protein